LEKDSRAIYGGLASVKVNPELSQNKGHGQWNEQNIFFHFTVHVLYFCLIQDSSYQMLNPNIRFGKNKLELSWAKFCSIWLTLTLKGISVWYQKMYSADTCFTYLCFIYSSYFSIIGPFYWNGDAFINCFMTCRFALIPIHL